MTKGIGRHSIAGRAGIARRPIATDYGVRSTQTAATSPQMFPVGSHSFAPTVSGWWKFVLWGGGGKDNNNGGGSGAYCEITKFVTTGQTVALSAGRGQGALAATASTATFPDGTVASAGGASGNTGGSASGGDVNLNGSTGGLDASGTAGAAGLGTGGGLGGPGNGASVGGGAGAPANLPYRGGIGGDGSASTEVVGRTPGGGCASGSIGTYTMAGDGQIIASLARS